jgi:hypothetical protein
MNGVDQGFEGQENEQCDAACDVAGLLDVTLVADFCACLCDALEHVLSS